MVYVNLLTKRYSRGESIEVSTDEVRLRYSKTGRAKYISHLDLSATIRRALLRAGVGLKYSEGFNPHPYISVALPLSVGVESHCELMDIRVVSPFSTDGLPCSINAVLPDGLYVHEASTSGRKFRDIAWIELACRLFYESGTPDDIIKCLWHKLAEREIVIQKKTKRGVSEIDIAPYIKDVELSEDEAVTVKLKVSAQDPSIGPEDIINAIRSLDDAALPVLTTALRIELYDKEMKVFR